MASRQLTTRWALDTNFLFHLAEGRETASAAWEIARERGIRLYVTDGVFYELLGLSETAHLESIRKVATTALTALRVRWGIEPVALSDLEHSIAVAFAEICLERRLLPPEERNDAVILAEAAVREIPFLITSDSHLLDIDREMLAVLSQAQDLSVVSILNPKSIVRSLG